MPIKNRQPHLRVFGLLFCCYSSLALALDEGAAMPMSLKSSGFAHQTDIPKQFTCDGSNVSPALAWAGVPQNAKSLVVIVDDPDVPAPFLPLRTWVHWLLYNIPPTVSELPQHLAPQDLPQGTWQGKNDWKETGYNGPCPPFGRHRYFFKLYALDTVLPDLNQPDKAALEKAMAGHIIGQAELIGTYKR